MITLRRTEWALAVYFIYVAVLARVLPARDPIPALTFWLNLTILAGYALLAYADSLRRRPLLGILRDWYPMVLFLLAYRQIGWLAPTNHSYELERIWVRWDKFFLNDMGVKALIESAGPMIPSLLEISYTLVYTTPVIALVVLYAYGHRKRADHFLFPFALSVLSAYVLFPYFPSEPPRAVFPGEDFPSYITVFRNFNWSLLGSYGIHTSVFPSAHVSGAFSAAFTMRHVFPERRWPWRLLLVMAILIATATVYGRYHYLADAAAGLAIALAVYGFVAGTNFWMRQFFTSAT